MSNVVLLFLSYFYILLLYDIFLSFSMNAPLPQFKFIKNETLSTLLVALPSYLSKYESHRFRDRDRLDPEGGLFLRDAPEMLAAGQWVARVPNKPGMA